MSSRSLIRYPLRVARPTIHPRQLRCSASKYGRVCRRPRALLARRLVGLARSGVANQAPRSCLVALLLLPVAALAEGRTALLPVEGEPALASRLERGIPEALTHRSIVILDAEGTRERLLADRAISRALADAGQLRRQADQALLRMQRSRAASTARQAIAGLEAAGARFHSAKQLAQAYEILARALLLRPADEPGAAEALSRAVAADRSYAPDPDRTPPRVRSLVEEARGHVAAPTAPSAAALAPLATAAEADRLVWLSIQRGPSGLQLELLVFSSRSGRIERHEHHTASEATLVEIGAARLALAPGPTPPRPSALSAASSPSSVAARRVPTNAVPTAPPKPWYKRWWIWTLAGVAVAGTSIGLGVGLSQRSSGAGSRWNVSFSF